MGQSLLSGSPLRLHVIVRALQSNIMVLVINQCVDCSSSFLAECCPSFWAVILRCFFLEEACLGRFLRQSYGPPSWWWWWGGSGRGRGTGLTGHDSPPLLPGRLSQAYCPPGFPRGLPPASHIPVLECELPYSFFTHPDPSTLF